MKFLSSFLKATILAGFLVIFPIFLLFMFFSNVVELVVAMATPIGDVVFGVDYKPDHPVLLSILVLLATSLLLGLLGMSPPARAAGRFLDHKIMLTVPFYRAFKNLTHSLLGGAELARFKPALYENAEGQKEYCFLIESISDEEAAALFPMSPTPMAGFVKIISLDRVTLLDASMLEVFDILTVWGVGTQKCIRSPRHHPDS